MGEAMQYRTDPRSGNQLSVLGFGMMRLPRGLTGPDIEKTTALVKLAIEQGVNYFDTAYLYSGSEEATGKALASLGLREQVFIATKLPHAKCRSYDDFDHIFDEQLSRLQTDYIDYYLIHNLPDSVPWHRLVELGIESWISEKKANGQIRQIGFSFHGSQMGFLDLLESYDWDFCQIQYNYLDVSNQAGQLGLRAAYDKGIMIAIMEPLRGGILASGLPEQTQAIFKAVDPSASMASWAFRWIWDQPEPTVVLSGMSTTEQLTDNINTATLCTPGSLSEAERDALNQAVASILDRYQIPCTGCNYCMPCPQGVNIPGCFASYNARKAQGLLAGYMQYFTATNPNRKEHASGPSICSSCKSCEAKCPQQIKISEALVEVKKNMEPFYFGAMKVAVRLFM
jgi:predicted aldo/keto reductase-like oxidoreductase